MTKKKEGFVIKGTGDAVIQRSKFKSTNRKFSIITYLLMLFLIIFPLTAFILAYTFPHLVFVDYLFNPIFYIFIAILLLIYFLIARFNYYILKIDAYVIDIKIFRAVIGIFNLIDYVDISHEMFIDFSFFNRPFSFNKTLMLKIKTDRGKIIKKNLNLSFLSKKEELRISRLLRKIIAKNKLGKEEVISNKY
jgi:hypothetical protein